LNKFDHFPVRAMCIRMALPREKARLDPGHLFSAGDLQSAARVLGPFCFLADRHPPPPSGEPCSVMERVVLTPINGISVFRRLFSCKKNEKIICKSLIAPDN
jgi:hypothetical protein